MNQITVVELSAMLSGGRPPLVLDVRESWELEVARLQNTLDIPMQQIPEHLDAIRDQLADRDLIVMCHSGGRSAMIVQFLAQNGFDKAFNLTGGIQAWSEQVDSTIPTY
ncbi:MAG: rhodanese-like domain-containing protein [Gammaproteobacteria bacterium]